jgi:hypothetical protein
MAVYNGVFNFTKPSSSDRYWLVAKRYGTSMAVGGLIGALFGTPHWGALGGFARAVYVDYSLLSDAEDQMNQRDRDCARIAGEGYKAAGIPFPFPKY